MKSKLLIFLLFVCLNTFGQSVPNTTTFSLQDVVNITGGTSLSAAFTNSVDALFDATYKGDKTSLYNFRNYGAIAIDYGWLYNWYVGVNAANIANTGWHMSTSAEWTTLTTYLGGVTIAGGALKEAGTTHWLTPNTGAINSSGFTARPGGYRYVDGAYWDMTKWGRWWAADSYSTTVGWGRAMNYNSDDLEVYNYLKKHGFSIVLISDAACATHGATGTYTGNDGHVYSTICIGNQEWMSENLVETKYRDDSSIPVVSGNAAWAALTTGARCIYVP